MMKWVIGRHAWKIKSYTELTNEKIFRMSRARFSSASLISPNPTHVLFNKIDHTGVITLNRVPAHNAINHHMTVSVAQQLKAWESDDSVLLVIIKGAGEKAFCAGGDVRELSETAQKDHSIPNSFQFLLDEYRTQYKLGTYKLPVVALAHGYCMGGGCGLAVNSRYTVATESTLMSMPETAIGFYPDNGGSHFLSHLSGELGTYLGLTCAQLKGADTYHAGLASHYIHSQSLSKLESDLLSLDNPSHENVRRTLTNYHEQHVADMDIDAFSLLPYLDSINTVFRSDHLESIIASLQSINSTWSQNTAKAILNNSPTALKVTLRMLHACKHLSLRDCLTMELQAGRAILQNHHSDFFRGVQAVLVDKTVRPQWHPDSIHKVTDDDVDQHFISIDKLGYVGSVSKL